MSPKNSRARIDANNRYNDKAYDRINLAIPKGQKATIQQYAEQEGESVNAYAQRAILQRMGLEEWPALDTTSSEEEV